MYPHPSGMVAAASVRRAYRRAVASPAMVGGGCMGMRGGGWACGIVGVGVGGPRRRVAPRRTGVLARRIRTLYQTTTKCPYNICPYKPRATPDETALPGGGVSGLGESVRVFGAAGGVVGGVGRISWGRVSPGQGWFLGGVFGTNFGFLILGVALGAG